MIMPCMKETSPGESGGRVACVSEGRVLEGWPGAPGWTTVPVGAEPDCWGGFGAELFFAEAPEHAAKKASRAAAVRRKRVR